MSHPDVTPAQILAFLTFVVGQLVAFGLLDARREQLVISIGSIAIGAAWKIADAVIRNGRAQVAAAAVSSGHPLEPAAPTRLKRTK